MSGVAFFCNVDWCQLRDFTLPAPFSDLIQSAHNRKRTTWHLPTSYLGPMAPAGTATDPVSHIFGRTSQHTPPRLLLDRPTNEASSRSSFFGRTKEWLDRRLSRS